MAEQFSSNQIRAIMQDPRWHRDPAWRSYMEGRITGRNDKTQEQLERERSNAFTTKVSVGPRARAENPIKVDSAMGHRLPDGVTYQGRSVVSSQDMVEIMSTQKYQTDEPYRDAIIRAMATTVPVPPLSRTAPNESKGIPSRREWFDADGNYHAVPTGSDQMGIGSIKIDGKEVG